MSNPQSGPTPALLTIAAFVRTYAISRATVYRLHHAGVITIKKRGRASVIDVADAQRFAASLKPLPRKNGGAP
jgi:hypothetical protein